MDSTFELDHYSTDFNFKYWYLAEKVQKCWLVIYVFVVLKDGQWYILGSINLNKNSLS